ncbi:MAG: hypothetical protein AAB152_05060 [Candidatus Coatesbacteria bacterium]
MATVRAFGRGTARRAAFVFFLCSGFCSLVYEVVWLRLAYAAFGVNTEVMSVVISVFMGGLALGSWWGGRWIGSLARGRSALWFYAAAEVVIGAGAFVVPLAFDASRRLLLAHGPADAPAYLASSAFLLALSLLPWCLAMGATFPFAMAFLRQAGAGDEGSFSYLYLANVIGAMTGTLAAALFLVELAGFRGTLHMAAGLNVAVAASAAWLATRSVRGRAPETARHASSPALAGTRIYPVVLFVTGFTSMGMEVAWIRSFTIILGNQIYSFAWLLAVYLFATWLGSAAYRRDRAGGRRPQSPGRLAGWAAVFALWPVLLGDPRLGPERLQVLISLMPFCFVLGYLTPRLVDMRSAGRPAEAGRAYAWNILGCILGPVAASYGLLPRWGAQATLAILAVPYLVLAPVLTGWKAWRLLDGALAGAAAACFVGATGFSLSFDGAVGSDHPPVRLLRDATATVVACGQGTDKDLYTNGLGLTRMTPVTKIMAHLPMVCLTRPPEAVAVICLGMGTTFRSMARWGVDTTAVELVPSVKEVFGFFHPDGPALERDPRFRVIIDDGRRFLMRTGRRFDVITVDPPPPVEAAVSSLLYSTEFYVLARSRLKPGGILQQWYPEGEIAGGQATLRALRGVFPHVRAFRSWLGKGVHFLASEHEIVLPGEAVIRDRMPPAARADLVEWGRPASLREFARGMPGLEVEVAGLLDPDSAFELTDDRPRNEYYLVRRLRRWISRTPPGPVELRWPWSPAP